MDLYGDLTGRSHLDARRESRWWLLSFRLRTKLMLHYRRHLALDRDCCILRGNLSRRPDLGWLLLDSMTFSLVQKRYRLGIKSLFQKIEKDFLVLIPAKAVLRVSNLEALK